MSTTFFTRHGRLLLVAALLSVGAVCLAGCEDWYPGRRSLIGEWENAVTGSSMVLSKEGAGAFNREIIHWGVDGKRFTISDGTNTLTGNYKVSGYILTIAYPEGDAIWVRKDKAEGFKKKMAAEDRKEAEHARAADNRSADNVAKEVSGGGGQGADILTDTRDGQVYRTVKMPDGKTWMAQNLNFKTESSQCYDDNADNCKKYGRLYYWEIDVCPKGWHLPSREEWGKLAVAVGGTGKYGDGGKAGVKLKAKSGWKNNGNGTDDYGFSALPGGSNDCENDCDKPTFASIGNVGYWWTATECDDCPGILYRAMYNGEERMGENNDDDSMLSVRCVKDE